jgi:hypothetical protein
MKIDNIIHCKYIALIGLAIGCNKRELITFDDSSGILTEKLNTNNVNNIKENDVIYMKSDYIVYFIDNILPNISTKFILVTANSDSTIPTDLLSHDKFINAINNEKIIHWYSQNCIETLHSKLTLIPLGVNFHCCAYEKSLNRINWKVETPLSPVDQEAIIINVLNNSKPFYERKIKCYSTYHFTIHPTRFGNQRKIAIEQIPIDLIDYEQKQVSRTDTWINQSQYAFVPSPMGNGMDCHRTWEALILGCIVIVIKSPLDAMFEGLPVLIIDKWTDITKDLLEETIIKFKNTTFNYNKLTLKYWLDKIYTVS